MLCSLHGSSIWLERIAVGLEVVYFTSEDELDVFAIVHDRRAIVVVVVCRSRVFGIRHEPKIVAAGNCIV